MTNYPQEFKDQLVALHRSGRTYMELGKEFNLAATSISNWVRAAEKQELAEGRAKREGGESDTAKIRRLEKELAEKAEEVEILGKAVAFFARRMDR
jgi:transposase